MQSVLENDNPELKVLQNNSELLTLNYSGTGYYSMDHCKNPASSTYKISENTLTIIEEGTF